MVAGVGYKEFKGFSVIGADLHSQDGSMADSSVLVLGSVDISRTNWGY